MINLLNSFDNYETWCFQINHCLEEHKLLCSVNTPFMHAKEKTTKIQYFWAIFFPLRVSLTHRHMFRFFWHQGTVTGCSLCLTTQPVTDFLLIDLIIGAIIIIPNHKEMDCTLFRIFFFFPTHTQKYVLSHSQWYFLYEISNHSAVKVSERKWTQTGNQSQWHLSINTPQKTRTEEDRNPHCLPR